MTDQPSQHPDDSGAAPEGMPPDPGSMPPPGEFPTAPPVDGYAPAGPAAPGQAGVVTPSDLPRPGTITLAVRLMWAGAALTVIQAVASMFMRDSMRTMVDDAVTSSGQSLTPAQVDSLVTVGVVTQVIVGLLTASIWVVMASTNGKGISWARILATVLFGLGTVFFLLGLLQPEPALSRTIGVLTVLIGAATIFALYQRDSSAFIAARSHPRAHQWQAPGAP